LMPLSGEDRRDCEVEMIGPEPRDFRPSYCEAAASLGRKERDKSGDLDKMTAEEAKVVELERLRNADCDIDEEGGGGAKTSQRRNCLQDDTMCAILGYATAGGPPQKPMLLGRTTIASAVGAGNIGARCKDPSMTTCRQGVLAEFLAKQGFAKVGERKATKTGVFRKGFTFPLHVAVAANDLEAVGALLSAGADRTALDSQHLTPLALATRLNKKGSHEGAILLLQH